MEAAHARFSLYWQLLDAGEHLEAIVHKMLMDGAVKSRGDAVRLLNARKSVHSARAARYTRLMDAGMPFETVADKMTLDGAVSTHEEAAQVLRDKSALKAPPRWR